MPSISRRRALRLGGAAAATAGLTALAGCSGMPKDAVIATEPAVTANGTPTDEDENVPTTVVRVSDLPDLQASIARTAIEERVYHVCKPSDAVGALASRFQPEGSYLELEGEYYPVYARVEDQVFSFTADQPETDGCGLL
jgi:hypothetical protein